MSPERANDPDPRVQHALSELRQLIQSRYPGATFTTFRGEDPVGMYLRATVDVEDTDEVVDVFIDRLVGLQVEEQLPIYVVTSRPVERVAGEMRSARPPHRHRALRRASLNP